MKTVLVVEDSNSSRDITSHFLQQGGVPYTGGYRCDAVVPGDFDTIELLNRHLETFERKW